MKDEKREPSDLSREGVRTWIIAGMQVNYSAGRPSIWLANLSVAACASRFVEARFCERGGCRDELDRSGVRTRGKRQAFGDLGWLRHEGHSRNQGKGRPNVDSIRCSQGDHGGTSKPL